MATNHIELSKLSHNHLFDLCANLDRTSSLDVTVKTDGGSVITGYVARMLRFINRKLDWSCSGEGTTEKEALINLYEKLTK